MSHDRCSLLFCVVCHSVSWTHLVSHAKNGELIEMPFRMWTCGPNNQCIRWGPRSRTGSTGRALFKGGQICPKVNILSESQEGSMRQCGLLTTITVATCLTQLCTVVVASVTLMVHSMKASSRSAQSMATKCFTGYALLSTGSGQRILTEGQHHPHTCHPRGGWVHSEAAYWPLCTVPSPLLLLCLLLTQSNAFQWGEQSPPWGGSGPPPDAWFHGPTQVHNPNSISIGSAIFVGLTVASNRQTDPHYICSKRPHLCTLCMRCGLTTVIAVCSEHWNRAGIILTHVRIKISL